MKFLKLMTFMLLSVGAICQAQIDTTRMEGSLTGDRKDFVHSLKPSLAIDDETTILRAHLLKLVVCRITSDAAKQFCKDIRTSEDLTGQNIELLDFALSSKNLSLVLEALAAVYRSAQSYAIGKEAKDQAVSLGPVMASAIARVGDRLKTAAYVLKEIQARPDIGKAFSENVALRVYEPFLHDALDWLKGNEPEGRGDPWEIAGATTYDKDGLKCRIRKSGKFQCSDELAGKRFDFPMENEEGYKLAIVPFSGGVAAKILCSQGPALQLHCWSATATFDGGIEIEKCRGANLPPNENSLYASSSQWYEDTNLASLLCGEKLVPRTLGWMKPLSGSKTDYWVAMNLAPDIVADNQISFTRKKIGFAIFLNYKCEIRNLELSCRPIEGIPSSNLHLWGIDEKTKQPVDLGTQDLFANIRTAISIPEGILAIRDGVCFWQDRIGFHCRHFVIDGDKALALDYESTASGGLLASKDRFKVSFGEMPSNHATVESWNFENYMTHRTIFSFDGGLPLDRHLIFHEYYNLERIACFSSVRIVDGLPDYGDVSWTNGSRRRCVQLNEKGDILNDIESTIPLNTKIAPQRIGRAMCIVNGDQMVCDFPALSKRVFEHPVLSINKLSSFIDDVNGYLCSAESDSIVCYDLKTPVPSSPKSVRYMYKAFSKELAATRGFQVRTVVTGTDPWLCSIYDGNPDEDAIDVCETAGTDAKVYRLKEVFEKASPARVAQPAPTPAPAKKPKSRRKSGGMADFFQPRRTATRAFFNFKSQTAVPYPNAPRGPTFEGQSLPSELPYPSNN